MTIPSSNGSGNNVPRQPGHRGTGANVAAANAELRAGLPHTGTALRPEQLTGRLIQVATSISRHEPPEQDASQAHDPLRLHADFADGIVKSTFDAAVQVLAAWVPASSSPAELVRCAAVAAYTCQRFAQISGDSALAEQMRCRVRTELDGKVTRELLSNLHRDDITRLIGIAMRTGDRPLEQMVRQRYRALYDEFRRKAREISSNGFAHLNDADLNAALGLFECWATTSEEKGRMERIRDAIAYRAEPELAIGGFCSFADALLEAGRAAMSGEENPSRFELRLVSFCRQLDTYDQTGLLDQPNAAGHAARIAAYCEEIAGMLQMLYSGVSGARTLQECTMERLDGLRWALDRFNSYSNGLETATESLRQAGDQIFDAIDAERQSLTSSVDFSLARLWPVARRIDAIQANSEVDALMRRCAELSALSADQLATLRGDLVSIRDRLMESRHGEADLGDLSLQRNEVIRAKGIGQDLRSVDCIMGADAALGMIATQLRRIDEQLAALAARNSLKRSRAEAGVA